MSGHTKEPWYWSEKHGEICHKSDADDQTFGMSCPIAINESNARRIIACVNACSGIETGTLEATAGDLRVVYDELTAQRDELLAAIKEAARYHQGMNSEPGKILRSAIAKAEAA